VQEVYYKFMNLKQKIAANTIFQLIGKIISATSTFIITILLAKKFGPEGFGDFEKILSFVSIFYLIVDFGLNAFAISEIKKSKEQKENLYGVVLGTRIILGIVLIFVCLSLLSFLPHSSTQGFTPFVRLGIILASLTILLQGLTITNNLLFQENLRYDKAIIASSFGYILFLLLTLIVVFCNLSLIFAVVSYVLFFVFYSFISFLLAKTEIKIIKPKFDKLEIIKLLKRSFPLGITLVFNVFYFRGDIIILSILKPTDQVAYYGLAYRFFEFALVFPTFFMNALYPSLIEIKKENIQKMKSIIFLSIGFLGGTGIMVAVFMFFLAPWLISLTNQSFSDSIVALRILVLSLPVFYLTSLFMWILVTEEKQKTLAVIYGGSMVVNLTLNFIFIPAYGYIASATITGLTEMLVLICTFFVVWKKTNVLNNKYV